MTRQRPSTMARRQERGFALLLVFAMAASVAILIYLEIPRVAFERQRDKEALLIDRGEQYVRALELYTRKLKKNPQTLDDLEHAQTVRFLRRRYKDPMTGKDEWRVVHVNAAGQYLDSKVHKATGALDKQDSGPSILASKIQGVGQSATIISQDGQGNSAALQKRASDRISPGSSNAPGAGGTESAQNAPAEGSQDPNQDANQQQNGAAPGQVPAAPPTGSFAPPKFPIQGQQAGGTQQQNGGGIGAAPSFGSVLPPGQPDPSASNGQNNSAQSPAMQGIQSILGAQPGRTSSSSAGTQTGTGPAPGAPSGLGPGIVGFATKLEMEGIRRYKDHSNYSEWEFIYDPNEANKGQGQGTNNQKNAGSSAAASAFGNMPGGTPAPPSTAPNN